MDVSNRISGKYYSTHYIEKITSNGAFCRMYLKTPDIDDLNNIVITEATATADGNVSHSNNTLLTTEPSSVSL